MPRKRQSVTNVNTSSSSNIDCCVKCLKNINDNDFALICELCKNRMHSICLGIPDSFVAFINSDAYAKSGFVLPLICVNCRPTFGQLIEIKNEVASLESRFEDRFAALEAAISAKVDVQSTRPAVPQLPHSVDLEKMVKSTIEAEKKRQNAVLFGLPETDDDLSAVRKLVSMGINNEDHLIVKPSEITHVFRDGPEYEDAPRLLKVVCVTSKVQAAFIDLINKAIKRQKPELRARPDLTWDQREAGRNLRKEFGKLRNSDDFFIDYKNRKIICKSNRQVVFSLASDITAAGKI